MQKQTSIKKLNAREMTRLRANIDALDLVPAMCGVALRLKWPRARIEAAAEQYRRFLWLVGSGRQKVCVPTADADQIWHEHLMQTRFYAEDCQRLFGRFIHHDGWAGFFGSGDLKRQRNRYRRSQQAIAALSSESKT